jgi:molybdopterin synthase catalytic subunit
VTGVEVIRLAELREDPLSVDELRAAVSDPGAGGIAIFAGAVRKSDHGRDVTRLSYSAHPSAAGELRRVAEKVAAEYEVIALAAVHRTGDLEIGDLAVVAAASCAHRAEAFEACHVLIDRLKHEVPIWKRQWFRDGSSEWVGGA